jgi:acyl-CoA synthetase (AMP-forming)/AMP-acid ligase II
VYDAVRGLTGHGLVERYGLTEALIVAAARADEPRVPGSVGRPITGADIRIADVEDGMGEIEIAGPTVFAGYYGRPDATAAAFTDDGWLRSGDLGSFDDDGLLHIVGRQATDLIKTGGHRVGAGEVESALLAHPAVAEAAVLGEPDDDLGERIVAFVVAGDGVTIETLAAHCADHLAPYKRPRDIRLVEALPRNPMGKVLKHALRR